MLRRIGDGVDVVTYLGDYTHRRVGAALSPTAASRMAHLPPGVDETVFRPGTGGAEIRHRFGLSDRPVVVCVSRLVPRKGQDVLIAALPQIRRRVPDAALLIVGGGPYGKTLRTLATDRDLGRDVVITGSVPWADLPAYYDAGDVFAMPCRTRRRGLDVEGLGIVFLEASATGLPVVAGDSGGAPDAVRDGDTGYVVDGRDITQIADRVSHLLANEDQARDMGKRGRQWIEEAWRWDLIAARLTTLLARS